MGGRRGGGRGGGGRGRAQRAGGHHRRPQARGAARRRTSHSGGGGAAGSDELDAAVSAGPHRTARAPRSTLPPVRERRAARRPAPRVPISWLLTPALAALLGGGSADAHFTAS